MLEKNDRAVIGAYFEDTSGLLGGFAERVVFPESEEDVRRFIIKNRGVPITISGAGTGVAGGRIPFGGVVLSLEKMNKIIKVEDNHAVVEPGVTVEQLKKRAESAGLLYPYDPTEQSAFVGGTVATNASGARSYRYGPTRDYVRRLKVVLGSGEVLNIRRGEIFAKDRTFNFGKFDFSIPSYKMPQTISSAGYFAKDNMDLIDLFIGQEGTLGVITEIELNLVKLAGAIFSSYVFFKDKNEAVRFADDLRKTDATAIEYLDGHSLRILRKKYSKIPQKLDGAIFFESEMHDGDKVLEELHNLMAKYSVPEGHVWAGMSHRQEKLFREIRHALPATINEIIKQRGFPKASTDIAVPVEKLDVMMDFYYRHLEEGGFDYVIFGHIGDGRLHMNIIPHTKEEFARGKALCYKFADRAVSLGGTVSAEHGIGKTRHKYLEILYGKSGIEAMIAVKRALDPDCVLGRGNIFPEEFLK